MTPTLLFILLFLIGIVLIVGEMLLPTHGVLGAMGGIAIAVGIGVSFYINQWLGLSVLLFTLAASPFVAMAVINLWPKTPIGRRILLPEVESAVQPPRVGLGQMGMAVSDLRPMGWCEFDDNRHEVRSESGLIPAGSRVRVVSIEDGRLIVRQV